MMTSPFIEAKLIDRRKIKVMIHIGASFNDHPCFYLLKEEEKKPLEIIHHFVAQDMSIYTLLMDEDFIFGSRYEVLLPSFSPFPLDITQAVNFQEFDELFTYLGDDLGAIYTKEETSFHLWAPLALNVFLKLEDDNHDFKLYEMKRSEKGVFRLTLKGDYLHRQYRYLVNNYAYTHECLDPYGKALSVNHHSSLVVDYLSLYKREKVIPLPKLNKYCDHIIYETNIRDLTEGEKSDIVHKGTYVGFYEEGRKTKDGHPAGLDYLKYLGVTTIQIQPLLDFYMKDERHPEKEYNWGYDPLSFFALEGSYSTDIDNPSKRLHEVRELVETYHRHGLRVTLDVVYNHLNDALTSDFERIVPQYFFRTDQEGNLTSCSGCGNDFQSERLMARKVIIDSLTYLVQAFDFDGFRFDLMGLIDEETMKMVEERLHALKPNLILYGEGWEMDYIHDTKKATINHASHLPSLAFFNDLYRDVIKGATGENELALIGYIGGNSDHYDQVVASLFGSSPFLNYPSRFLSAEQSLNYLECHDNHTLFDKLCVSNPNDDLVTRRKRITMGNTLVSLSFGIPFFHMGEEVGSSKKGEGNSYNLLHVNTLDYDLVDQRWEEVERFRRLNLLRQQLRLYTLSSEELASLCEIDFAHYPLILISIQSEEVLAPYQKAIMILNNQNENYDLSLDDYYRLFLLDGSILEEEEKINALSLEPLSVTILVK